MEKHFKWGQKSEKLKYISVQVAGGHTLKPAFRENIVVFRLKENTRFAYCSFFFLHVKTINSPKSPVRIDVP